MRKRIRDIYEETMSLKDKNAFLNRKKCLENKKKKERRKKQLATKIQKYTKSIGK